MVDFSTAVSLLAGKERPRLDHYPEAWWASSWEFGPGQVQWFISHEASRAFMPTGATGAILSIPPEGFSFPAQSAGFNNHVSPIADVTYTYTDVAGAISNVIADKYANNIGTRDKPHRVYRWPKDEALDLTKHLVSTYFIANRENGDGTKEIQCKDVKRLLKTKIWNPVQWNLVSTIDESQTDNIILYGPEPVYFEHDHNYSADPDELIAYVRTSEGEIISFTGHTNNGEQRTLVGVTRAALGSYAQTVRVEGNQKLFNRPEVKEWVYYEENTPDFIRGLIVGETYDGRAVPWNAGTDKKWIDDESLAYAAPDLNFVRWRAENFGETTVKELIEKELLPFMPGLMLVNPEGQIEFYRMTSVAEDGTDPHVFDQSNVDLDSVSSIRVQNSQVVNSIELEFDWSARAEVFRSKVEYQDSSSSSITPNAGKYSVQSKLLHKALHTNSQIDHFISVIGDIKFHEIIELDFNAAPSTVDVQVGDRVRVDFDFRRDDSTNRANFVELNRSVVVTGKTPNDDGSWNYTVYGTRQRASDVISSQLSQHLNDSNYPENGVDLSTVTTIVPNGPGNYLMTGGGSLSLNQKYYFNLGNLQIQDGVTLTASDNGPFLDLWIMGGFAPLGIMDTTGQGKNAGGSPGQLGDRGHALPVHAAGSISATQRWQADKPTEVQSQLVSMRSFPPLYYRHYSSGDAPEEALSNNNGRLVGLPEDLSGYGGPGSEGGNHLQAPTSITDPPVRINRGGRAGGRSGAGIRIICRDISYGPNTKFITNGAPGDDGYITSLPPGGTPFSVYTAAGSGGGPGSVRVYIDSGAPLQDPTPYVEAKVGASASPGIRLGGLRTNLDFSDAGAYRPYHTATPDRNFASAVTRVSRIPVPDVVQDRPDDAFALESLLNPDANVKLIVQASQPSNPNNRDLWITPTELARDTATPTVRRFNSSTGLWDVVTYPDSITTVLVQVERTYGAGDGTTLYFTQDGSRPTDYEVNDLWLDEKTDTLWRLGATQADDVKVNREEFGYRTADNYLADGDWIKWFDGDTTVFLAEDRSITPSPTTTVGTSGRLAFPKVTYVDRLEPRSGFHFGATIGDGATPGLQIDAAGLGTFRYVSELYPIPVAAGKQYLITSLVKCNSMVTTNSDNQGYGVMLKFYNHQGNLTYTNDIDNTAVGNGHWFGENRADFTPVYEFIRIPANLSGIAYMTVQPIVHGVSGNVIISSIKAQEQTKYVETGENVSFAQTYNGSGAENLAATEWIEAIARGREIAVDGQCDIRLTSGFGTATMFVIIDSGSTSSRILSQAQMAVDTTTRPFSWSGSLVDDTFPHSTMRHRIVVEIDGGFTSTINITGLRYTYSHDAGVREGW